MLYVQNLVGNNKTGLDNYILCISISYWMLRPPESWPKHFSGRFQPFLKAGQTTQQSELSWCLYEASNFP